MEPYQQIRADYYTEVRGLAREALAEIAAGNIRDRGELDEWIDAAADGSSRVIYYQQALETLFASDNAHAIDDAGLDPTMDDDGIGAVYCRAAYFALREDLKEAIESLWLNAEETGLPEDFDLDDEDTWPANRSKED